MWVQFSLVIANPASETISPHGLLDTDPLRSKDVYFSFPVLACSNGVLHCRFVTGVMTARVFSVSASVARTVDATRVEYRTLGKSGLHVSFPILGGLSFGNSRWMDWVLDEDQALPVLKAAYDLGINTVSDLISFPMG